LFIIYHLLFIIYHLSFIVYHLSFIIYHLSFIIYHAIILLFCPTAKMYRIVLTVGFYKKHRRIHDSYILEYIWIDGRGNLRSKYRTAYPKFDSSCAGMGSDNYIPVEHWNYDGSKSSADNNEILLVPVAHYANPFFEPGRAFLVLCDTYRGDGTPTETNFRHDAEKVFESGGHGRRADPWFKIEQEYFITQSGGVESEVVIFPQNDENSQRYCCGVGSRTVTLRRLAEKHYEYCLRAGLKISGINAEVAFQIGPCSAISAGDELWVARYILHKLSEEFGVCITFQPKPLPSPSTLNTKFSTEESRDKNGLKCIYKYIDRLLKKCSHDAGFAPGECGASVRIPNSVLKAGCGYLEDRRPASDADPYQVIAAIFSTACCC
jgi:glutamine synthetase